MKKNIRAALLLLLIAALLCTTVLAADANKPGVYGVTKDTGVDITWKNASGATVSPASATLKGESVTDFYADAEQCSLTCSDLTPNEQYLIFVLSNDEVPKDGNIVYIWQDAANSSGSLTFSTVYPSKLEEGKTYYVRITGSGASYNDEIATFKYYVPYCLGNINNDKTSGGDDIIDVEDSLLALQIAAKLYTPTDTEIKAGNVNGDFTSGGVDIVDVEDSLLILQYAAKLITKFPAES